MKTDLALQTHIVRLCPGDLADFVALLTVFEAAFKMEGFKRPPDTHLQKLLEDTTFIALAAKQGEVVVGGVTAYILAQYYAEKPIAYIYDLAVLPGYQRLGIGHALMAFINGYCREQGFEESYVQADKADEHALDFYRTTQPTTVLHTMQFGYSFAEK